MITTVAILITIVWADRQLGDRDAKGNLEVPP